MVSLFIFPFFVFPPCRLWLGIVIIVLVVVFAVGYCDCLHLMQCVHSKIDRSLREPHKHKPAAHRHIFTHISLNAFSFHNKKKSTISIDFQNDRSGTSTDIYPDQQCDFSIKHSAVNRMPSTEHIVCVREKDKERKQRQKGTREKERERGKPSHFWKFRYASFTFSLCSFTFAHCDSIEIFMAVKCFFSYRHSHSYFCWHSASTSFFSSFPYFKCEKW